MYGLPADFDAAIFIGKELEQVSFTANTVRLAFAEDVAITLESRFAFQTERTAALVVQEPPVQASTLMALVGQTVGAAEATRSGTLRLEFAEGGVLVCHDDSTQYEAYRIRIGNQEIVV